MNRFPSVFKQLTLPIVALFLTLVTSISWAKDIEIAATTESEFQDAIKEKSATNVNLKFPSFFFDQEDSVFSRFFAALPERYPEYKLNTIGRGLHTSLLYLEDYKLSDAIEVIRFFRSITKQDLEKHHLLDTVTVFDPSHIQVAVLGTKSKFFVIVPTDEFKEWQIRFWALVQEKAPQLIESHKKHRNLAEKSLSKDSIHFSLLQVQLEEGKAASFDEEKIRKDVEGFIRKQITIYELKSGKKAQVQFSLKDIPIRYQLPASSFKAEPLSIAELKWNSVTQKPEVSAVGTWSLAHPKPGQRKNIEFRTEELATEGDLHKAFELSASHNPWIRDAQEYTPQPMAEFLLKLPAKLKEIYSKISQRFYSDANLPVRDENGNYHTSLTHPMLETVKAKNSLDVVRKLNLVSTAYTSLGFSVYASSVRKEILYPGDFDLLVSTLVHVPDEVKTLEEAKDFSASAFVTDVLSPLLEKAKREEISFTELRIGSDATMGISPPQLLTGYEENPYLSQEDLIKGTYTDKTGREWKLENLLRLGDFTKGKIDYFDTDGKRFDLSLQFVSGFEWNGQVYSLQKDGLKGIPPLIRTAVYENETAFAVSSTLQRAYDYYAVQKGSILTRSARDILKSGSKHSFSLSTETPLETNPLYNSKFLKKVYNFFILLDQGDKGEDEVIFSELKNFLVKNGLISSSYSLKELVEDIVSSINQKEIRLLTNLRRNINDFREFNERKQKFSEKQWNTRKAETLQMLPELKAFKDLGSAESEIRSQLSFLAVALESQPNAKQNFESDAFHFRILQGLENNLLRLDGEKQKISVDTKTFLKHFAALVPHLLDRYDENRTSKAKLAAKWNRELMGYSEDPEVIEALEKISHDFRELTLKQMIALQHVIYHHEKEKCATRLKFVP